MDPLIASHLPALAWLLASSCLVFFMQAGFAAVESGAVRFKNSINVALKNVIDLCCSFAAYFVVGFALMFGSSITMGGWGVIGDPKLFLDGVKAFDPKGTDVYTVFPLAMFLFQVTFCNTAATIVSGGIAERCRFMPYVLMSFGIGILIYPVFGHWAWGGGWLAQLGYHDFAGSSVVHLLGAAITLAGIHVLGPRAGRYDADGKPVRIPASSMPMVALGVCFLAFGWIGFNGGSAPLSEQTATIIINTLNAGCFGGLAVMLAIWALRGVPDADLILNGVLGGLVAITANANVVSLGASAVIGIIGGIAVLVGSRLMDRWKLDDAVGAVPVHGFAGVTGVVCTALFADGTWLTEVKKMDRLHFLGVQLVGAAACMTWGYLMGLLLWKGIGRVTPLRIGADEEAVGMNYSEHQVSEPVQELTALVAEALKGRDARRALDDVREGDLVPLARAVQTLIDRLRDGKVAAERWRSALQEVRSILGERRSSGTSAVEAMRTSVQEAADGMRHLHELLMTHAPAHSLAPVLGDLVKGLAARLDDAAGMTGRMGRTLETLHQAEGRLGTIGDEMARIPGARA